MEDVAVYGYMTPLKLKIIIALALSDSVVRDADVITVCLLPHLTFHFDSRTLCECSVCQIILYVL